MKQAKKRIKVLIVDDEIGIRELLSEILIDEGYAVVTAADAQTAHRMRHQEAPDIVLLDIWMPDTDGITLLRQWKEIGYDNVPVVVMSGHATIDTAVEATQLGALEVLEKPVTTERLFKAINKAKLYRHKREFNLLLKQMDLGSTPAMQEFKKELIEASAQPGLLTMVGPINCGAPFFARFLARPKSPAIIIDNGTTLEGNIADIIRSAEDGVIVARLVNTFNATQQNGFLGLIRETNKSKVRLVAVSTQHPEALNEKSNTYNETLIALLARRVVQVPSLNAFADDIPRLIELIRSELVHGGEMQKRKISAAAIQVLARHYYEEDFAELISVVRTLLLYTQGDTVEAATAKAILKQLDSISTIHGMFDQTHNMSLREARDYFEREYFLRLINTTNGNMQLAAKIAGIERTYFYRKLKQYIGGKTDAED